MFTVKQMSDFLELSAPGLHRWADKYAELLDPAANDPTGAGRQFTEHDVEVLWTVKALRDQNIAHNDILERLQKGYRLEPPFMPDQMPAAPATVARSEIELLRQNIAEKNAEIDQLRGSVKEKDAEIERLKGQVEALRQALKDLFESK